MKQLLVLIFSFLSSLGSMCQGNNEVNQILKVIPLGRFIYNSAQIQILDEYDIKELKEYAKEFNEPISIPDSIILELFSKTLKQDTSFRWTYKYFPDKIIIVDRSFRLNHRQIIRDLSIPRRSEKARKIIKLVESWNAKKLNDENSYTVSYPIFDKTRQYALVSYGYGNGNLNGRSFIYIYRLENNKWKEVLLVKNFIS